ncbi:DUF881 domain-containing protein [Romboutsia lituseburensis]|uniref:DUF881 domain-containing protein n=1 Tax=Romboutsia lituseburensis TaxID=1537 RepID=UPI00215B5F7D|nr:DUF881 domain-containing protein [Romboutsia lituseburensis]MCR8746138.1 DUF881 domain-containing protein [Romboutsia lituseburensis]
MKNKYMLIILMSIVSGAFIGIVLKDNEVNNNEYISKIKLLRKETKVMNKDIKNLEKEKDNVEDELNELKNKFADEKSVKEIGNLKKYLTYTDIKDKGIAIKIDAISADVGNIANLIDYNKILINLVNEIKINGGEFISINDQRLNQYSEIVLAGSHININSVPIVQPYEIKVIGNLEKLNKYIEKDSDYIKSIKSSYPIKVDFKVDENILMKKMNVPNKLEYIKGD